MSLNIKGRQPKHDNNVYSGGPAGLVYQFLIVWIGTASVYACLSELASMYFKSHQIIEAWTEAY